MSKGVTISIRLDSDLRDRLEHATQTLHRGKNWIIQQALQNYLSTLESTELMAEARRQSLLASGGSYGEDDWENAQDTSGWE